MKMTDLADQLEIMRIQEVTAYRTVDYLSPSFQRSKSVGSLDDPAISMDLSVSSGNSESSGRTEMWREKICEWCYQVIDHFDFSREIVAIAMNYLDRYLATKVVNKKIFQLAAMTALFLAVKLHEPSKLSMASMIELSRGCFDEQQMAAMELSLLRSLRWYLHPPTAQNFANRYLHLLSPGTIKVNVLYDVLEFSRFLTELSVIDYFFVTRRPSDIALASIANAMQDLPSIHAEVKNKFYELVLENFMVDIESSQSISECRSRLRVLYALQGSGSFGSGDVESQRLRGETSPVSVLYGAAQ